MNNPDGENIAVELHGNSTNDNHSGEDDSNKNDTPISIAVD